MSAVSERLTAALADRYRIERELGQGGMATVYLAHDIKHDRKVALKVLKPELAAVVGAQRFLAEIRTTANLQHPHILPLHDSGEVQGTVFYVMPLVDGESLRDRLKREKQLPIPDAVRIATEVADALAYAHGHGVIHRDVKPENILLHGEHAMVADFGIALAAHATGGQRMTETGMSLGTPAYMSPEQAMGERTLDARTDVYALGCVLYEMLVGDPPFQGSTAQAIVAKVLTERPVPPGATRDTVPVGVETVVLRALAKLPADRFAGAQEFARALVEGVGTETVGVSGGVARSGSAGRAARLSERKLVIAFGGVALMATGVAVWLMLTAPSEPAPTQYALATGPGTLLPVTNAGALSPDGSRLVLNFAPGEIWLKRRDAASGAIIAGTARAMSASFSPDGRAIVWSRASGEGEPSALLATPVDGGSPTVLAESISVDAPGIASLDDGSAIATRQVGAEFTLVRVPRGGGTAEVVHRAERGYVATFPVALPGSRGVLFIRFKLDVTEPELWGLDLRTGDARRVLTGTRLAAYIGRGRVLLLGEDNELRVALFDADRLALHSRPVPLFGGVRADWFAASHEGTVVAWQSALGQAGDVDHEAVWLDRAGRATRADSSWRFGIGAKGAQAGWSLSPDGRSLAIGLTRSSSINAYDTWVKRLPDGPLTRVTDGPAAFRPRWSRDGRSILHAASALGEVRLHRADGSGRDSLLATFGFLTQEVALSPDGRWVLARGILSTGGRDIYGIELGSQRPAVPIVATDADESSFSLSSDGRWILFEERKAEQMEIVVRPFPDANSARFQVSPRGGFAPLWSRDGREIFYLTRERDLMVVAFSVEGGEPRFGAPRRLFRLPDEYRAGPTEYYTTYDISPDGQRFLMMRAVEQSAAAAPTLLVFEHMDREIDRVLRGAPKPD